VTSAIISFEKARRHQTSQLVQLAQVSGIQKHAWWVYYILICCSFVYVITLPKSPKVIGFCSFIALPGVPVAYLMQIAIAPQAQGLGVGSRLLSNTLTLLKTRYRARWGFALTFKDYVENWLQHFNFNRAMAFRNIRLLQTNLDKNL